MNEPDLINNRYQLHLAMEQADKLLPEVFAEFGELSGRYYGKVEAMECGDAENILVLLGSSYDTAMDAVEELRKDGKRVGAATLHVLRPFPGKELMDEIGHGKHIVLATSNGDLMIIDGHSYVQSLLPFTSYSDYLIINHSSIHPSIHSSIHPFIHSFIHSIIHPSNHSFIHSSNHSFIHSFIHFIHPSIHSFIHSHLEGV